jgi:hypothetical protein
MVDDGHEQGTDYLVSELAETANHIVCPDNGSALFFDDPDFIGVIFTSIRRLPQALSRKSQSR